MNKGTALMVGIAGISLATAMFFDSTAPKFIHEKAKHSEVKTNDIQIQTSSTEPLLPEHGDTENEKEEQDKKTIDRINENAYYGNGDPRDKRMYLYSQAYRKSRESTPIVPVQSVMLYRGQDKKE
jgi:hypothetical protein